MGAFDDLILTRSSLRSFYAGHLAGTGTEPDLGPAGVPGTYMAAASRGGVSLVPSQPTSKSIGVATNVPSFSLGDVYDAAGNAPFTVGIVYKPDLAVSPTQYRRIVSKEADAQTQGWDSLLRGSGEGANAHKVTVERKITGTTQGDNSVAALATNVAVLHTFTYDGLTLKQYVNATLQGAGIASPNPSLPNTAATLVVYAPGAWSHLHIFDAALTAAEVAAHHAVFLAAPTLNGIVVPSSVVFAQSIIGGANPPEQSLSVQTDGASAAWSIASIPAGLTVTPASGSATPASVQLALSTTGLVAPFADDVVVTITGAVNSPLTRTVTCDMIAGALLEATYLGSPIGQGVGAGGADAGLAFVGQLPASPPASQTIVLSNPGGVAMDFTILDAVTGSNVDAANLTFTPSSGTIAPGGTQNVVVAVTLAGQTSGLKQYDVSIIPTPVVPGGSSDPRVAPANLRAELNSLTGKQEIIWSKVASVTEYEIAEIRPTGPALYYRDTTTSRVTVDLGVEFKFVPIDRPGETVIYGCRTSIAGSTWVADGLRPSIVHPAVPGGGGGGITGIVMGMSSQGGHAFKTTDARVAARMRRLEFGVTSSLASIETEALLCAQNGTIPLVLWNWSSQPSDVQCSFLGQVAARIGVGGTFWQSGQPGAGLAAFASPWIEFGNEISYRSENGLRDAPGTYAQKANIACDAIAAANPAVKLLVESNTEYFRSGFPNFVQGMRNAVPALGPKVGGWVQHPYGPISRQERLMNRSVTDIRAAGWVVDATRPFFITEVGIAVDETSPGVGKNLTNNYEWPTNFSYAQAGAALDSSIRSLVQKYQVKVILFYQQRDQIAPGPTNSRENWFGAVKLSGVDKGAYTTAMRNLNVSIT